MHTETQNTKLSLVKTDNSYTDENFKICVNILVA